MRKFLLILSVFIFALSVRYWRIGDMGETWDEFAYVSRGNDFIQLLVKFDFKNNIWYDLPDHPPLARYLYGLGSIADVNGKLPNGKNGFDYDLFWSRSVSILFSSLAVVVVCLIGVEFISTLTGVLAGIFMATIPFYLGLSQLVTLESIVVFFFTLTIYIFLKFLDKRSKKLLVFSGISLGMALSAKITNILIIPTMVAAIAMAKFYKNKITYGVGIYKDMLLIIFISIVTFVILWPPFIVNPILMLSKMAAFRSHDAVPKELFFGSFAPVPIWYFVIYFFITTPLIVLVMFFVGVIICLRRKNWVLTSILLWFAVPFIQSFYPFKQNGLRYIAEIYAPLSLIVAVGTSSIINKFTKDFLYQALFVLGIAFYFFIMLLRIAPYYLDYFNFFVGGAQGVYEHRLFSLSWWGEGQKEAAVYLSQHANYGSKVGLFVTPLYVIPPVRGLIFDVYKPGVKYDYLVVNFLHLSELEFNTKEWQNKYDLVYFVNADGAQIVQVYKHR